MPDPATPAAATPPTPPKKSFGTLKRPATKPQVAAAAATKPAPKPPAEEPAAEEPEAETDGAEAPDLGPYNHLPPEEVVRLNDLMEEWTEQLPLYIQSDLGVMFVRLLDQVLKNAIIENGVPEIVTRLKTVEEKNKIEVPDDLLVEWDEEEDEEEEEEEDEDEEEDDDDDD